MSSMRGAPSPGLPGPIPRCVNVQEAKIHLLALLARAAAGERIVLARHGKPIAQLVPLDPSLPAPAARLPAWQRGCGVLRAPAR